MVILMNKLRLFSQEIDPSCDYCKYGFITHRGDSILCEKQGVTLPGHSCKKFVYAPLKRIPKRPNALPEFSPSDFEL